MNRIYYRGGYKYQLARQYRVRLSLRDTEARTKWLVLDADGHLTIRAGYAWDGPSGPTIDTPSFMRGSLVHDALYQLIRLGKLHPNEREAADDELRRICLEDGMPSWRAWWVHRAVRRHAARSALPENKKQTHSAP